MVGVRRWCLLLATLGASQLTTACSRREPPFDPMHSYLEDAAFRRTELVASLQTIDNSYSRTRLAHYARNGPQDWEALPVWNPRAEPATSGESGTPGGARLSGPLSDEAHPLIASAAALSGEPTALAQLGELAFFRYPVQLAPLVGRTLSPAQIDAYGLWRDPDQGVGGLVRAAMADGTTRVELSCATCHAAQDRQGHLVAGLPNSALDMGAMMAAGDVRDAGARRLLAWGHGRVGVSPEDGNPPIRIPDLRPTRWLTHLQTDATVVQRNVVSLAIRLETLIITSHQGQLRPPRVVALALAVYLWKLAGSLPAPGVAAKEPAQTGKLIFETHCGGCHAGQGLTGPPRPLAMIGTDPLVGLSKDRGTGLYRVPSLRGLSTRGPLLHDASIASAADLLDPNRLYSTFKRRLHGAGAVPGHVFGLDLEESSRRALVAYLNIL
jgi:cytochrome c5